MEQVIVIFKKVYGDDHPNVATALNNLAQLLQDQVSVPFMCVLEHFA